MQALENMLNNLLTPLRLWLQTLEERERYLVIGGAITLFIMLFYLIIWEPISSNYEQQLQTLESQRQLYSWVKATSAEINALKSAGGSSRQRFKNQSISSLADRSATTTGIKPFIEKIEQSKKGVKIRLKSANFDRMVVWLTDMQNKYGIYASKLKIEKTEAPGAVDASITLERAP